MRVETEHAWGGTLVRAVDAADNERRFWFDETDKGRVVLCAQIHVTRAENVMVRDYVPRRDWDVPQAVQDALIENGLEADTIYDTRGIEIA